MNEKGKIIFFIGVSISVIMGIIVSLDPGTICQLDANNLPDSLWTYPALCFIFWAFSVPLGIIIAAIGVLLNTGTKTKTILWFSIGMFLTYLFISFANGPMPHVPILFGIGGAIILLFYFSILWINAQKLQDNVFKLTGYTFLIIGFWFTCGLGGRQYQPALGAGESPIDIMTYFVLAMLFFWLSEKRKSQKQ